MQYLAPDALARARRVRLVIFDVDGVLTDGRLWYGPEGEELKAFHAFDGHGVHLLREARLDTAIISGRQSPAVEERARQLGIKHVVQGADDKLKAFERMLRRLRMTRSAAAYMGDDFVDLPVLTRCGFACVPHEAPEDLRRRAHYIASADAGHGAAREVCEFILEAQGKLGRVMQRYLK
ncbi:MAG TPA: phenylphosphate carboxylase subunit delta [Burkholderiales bacterium]|nr:phenylphosphate carboxylase subunit delta [Burkholderiales bacterium]